jgi:TRAP-type mannitol/chloroaromatic compound transport system permease small subunit
VSGTDAAAPIASRAAPSRGGGADPLLAWGRQAARAGAWFGGLIVAAAAFLISVDVIVRKLFSVTLGGASEVSGYVLAVSTSWALALALLDRAHVRIDTLYELLPVRLCAVLDVAGLLAFMLFAGMVTWQGWILFAQSFELGSRSLTPLETPLAIPQFLWVIGFAFFFAVMLLLLARALAALATGRVGEVRRLLGSRTAQQELDEALEERARGTLG